MPDQDPRHLPEPSLDPPCLTEAEYYDSEWADRQEEKWNSLGSVLESMKEINSKLKTFNQYNILCNLGGNRAHSIGFLLNVIESAIKIRMGDIKDEMLDKGFAPPEGALEEP